MRISKNFLLLLLASALPFSISAAEICGYEGETCNLDQVAPGTNRIAKFGHPQTTTTGGDFAAAWKEKAVSNAAISFKCVKEFFGGAPNDGYTGKLECRIKQ